MRYHFLEAPSTFGVGLEFYPPTQKNTALAVEECINGQNTISTINVSCFGGFRYQADDPPTCSPNKFFGRREPWACVPEGFTVGGRSWVWFLAPMGLPVGLHFLEREK